MKNSRKKETKSIDDFKKNELSARQKEVLAGLDSRGVQANVGRDHIIELVN